MRLVPDPSSHLAPHAEPLRWRPTATERRRRLLPALAPVALAGALGAASAVSGGIAALLGLGLVGLALRHAVRSLRAWWRWQAGVTLTGDGIQGPDLTVRWRDVEALLVGSNGRVEVLDRDGERRRPSPLPTVGLVDVLARAQHRGVASHVRVMTTPARSMRLHRPVALLSGLVLGLGGLWLLTSAVDTAVLATAGQQRTADITEGCSGLCTGGRVELDGRQHEVVLTGQQTGEQVPVMVRGADVQHGTRAQRAAGAAGRAVWATALLGLATVGARRAVRPRTEDASAVLLPAGAVLRHPWAGMVAEAEAAQQRFDHALQMTAGGSVRDALHRLRPVLQQGVAQMREVAVAGQRLEDGLTLLEADAESPAPHDRSAQLRVRLDQTLDRMRTIDAHLDELVGRAVELSLHTEDGGRLDVVQQDLADAVAQLDHLRGALAELR